MPIYILIENSDLCLKTLKNLWQRDRDKPALEAIDNFVDFLNGNNNSISFKFKPKKTGHRRSDCRKDVEIMVPLKYPSK